MHTGVAKPPDLRWAVRGILTLWVIITHITWRTLAQKSIIPCTLIGKGTVSKFFWTSQIPPKLLFLLSEFDRFSPLTFWKSSAAIWLNYIIRFIYYMLSTGLADSSAHTLWAQKHGNTADTWLICFGFMCHWAIFIGNNGCHLWTRYSVLLNTSMLHTVTCWSCKCFSMVTQRCVANALIPEHIWDCPHNWL